MNPNNSQQDTKKKYYFYFVDFPSVSSELSLTNSLLNERKENKSLTMNDETINKLFKAIEEETERLSNSKMKTFINNVYEISNSIKDVWLKKDSISYNQFICLFNLLYGLSKCY